MAIPCAAQPSSPINLSLKGNVTSLHLDSPGTVHAALVSDSSWYLVLKPDGSISSKYLVSPNTLSSLDFGVEDPVTLFSWRSVTMFFNSYIRAMSRSHTSGVVSEAIDVNDSYHDAQRFSPKVVGVDDTTFFVLWSGNGQQFPVSQAVYGQFVSTSLNRLGPNIAMSDDSVLTRDNSAPRIALSLTDGRIGVIWMRHNGWGNSMVVRSFSPSAVPLAPSVSVSTDTSRRYLWGHSIAALPNDFIVAWSATVNDSLCNVYMRRFDLNGSPKGPEVQVNSESAARLSEAEIAVDATGNTIIAWESATTPQRIYGQRIDPLGVFVGSNFALSVVPDTLNHYYPLVALRRDTIYSIWNTPAGPKIRVLPFNNEPVSVESAAQLSDPAFSLAVNPNPFNSYTHIVLDLKRSGFYSLGVFDVLGRKIANLSDSFLEPGRRSFIWNASANASGLYFVRIVSGDIALTHQLLLIK